MNKFLKKYNISAFKKEIFLVCFFYYILETADLRSYCGYFWQSASYVVRVCGPWDNFGRKKFQLELSWRGLQFNHCLNFSVNVLRILKNIKLIQIHNAFRFCLCFNLNMKPRTFTR